MSAELSVPAPAGSSGRTLVVTDLRVAFGGVQALSGVNAEISLHSVTALVGPNGAGKTTFLNAVNGLLRGKLSGQILINGRDTTTMRPADLARLGVARSFQEPRLIDNQTVLENLVGGAHSTMRRGLLSQLVIPRLAAREDAVATRRAMDLLEVLEIAELARLQISQLSYGHRKLVDLGRAVMRQPVLLLLDEPSSGLDEREQLALAQTIRRLHERERTTILLVEHHMTLVRAVADWMLGMQTGAVVVAGPPEDVLESTAFKDALMGRVHTEPAVDLERSEP